MRLICQNVHFYKIQTLLRNVIKKLKIGKNVFYIVT